VISKPRPGLTGEVSFTVEPQHVITFAGGAMPAVLSTPNLVHFLEMAAREVLNPFFWALVEGNQGPNEKAAPPRTAPATRRGELLPAKITTLLHASGATGAEADGLPGQRARRTGM
jgi:hypothetical protein